MCGNVHFSSTENMHALVQVTNAAESTGTVFTCKSNFITQEAPNLGNRCSVLVFLFLKNSVLKVTTFFDSTHALLVKQGYVLLFVACFRKELLSLPEFSLSYPGWRSGVSGKHKSSTCKSVRRLGWPVGVSEFRNKLSGENVSQLIALLIRKQNVSVLFAALYLCLVSDRDGKCTQN
jgi:hypothetical protein